jgi:endonuclease/exonuclease/phosphatase family metal-dependent hydrolase
LQNNQLLVRELSRFPTLKQLYASEFFRKHQTELDSILYTPQMFECVDARPRIRAFLRVAEWNIERGNNFEGVLHYLQAIPRLAAADILFLNELDVGMLRTRNRHVANDLGQTLGYHVVYFPEYIELTKGIGEELNLSGENTTALHGNAILSRYPIANPRVIDLPVCFEHYEFHEKRYGRRIAIIADIDFNGRIVTVVNTHLEVRNTPQCRSRQMRAILDKLEEWKITGPVILAGDFNSNSFARGTRLRTFRGGWWLLRGKPEEVKRRLLHPYEGSEPLFDVMKDYGFDYKDFNSDDQTARVPINMVEEVDRFPTSVQQWIHRRLTAYNHELLMRLDWICGRNVRSLTDAEITDSISGIVSEGPQTFRGLYYQERRASDHAAIAADIAIDR